MQLGKRDIQKVKRYMANKPVKKVFLFGSFVHGSVKGNSDIDLLIELDHSQPIGLEFVQMKLDLEELLHREVDLVSTGGFSNYIQPEVDKHKVLIYAK
jgi:hypothetical protein